MVKLKKRPQKALERSPQMPTINTTKIRTKHKNLYLRVSKGHFATNHSHSNYYIDVVAQKSRLSEAKAVAKELCSAYNYSTTIVDTILCLDGNGKIEYNGESFSLVKGDSYFIPAGLGKYTVSGKVEIIVSRI